MGDNGGRTGRKWREARARVLATSDVCGICGGAVNMSLPGTHPEGPTVDHVAPVGLGGAMVDGANLQLAHLRCNQARGAQPVTSVRSREW